MKIPKYIDEALRLRTKYADLLAEKMYLIDEWLDKNHIECELCDTHTGVEIYCNPSSSEIRVKKCIRKHGDIDGM